MESLTNASDIIDYYCDCGCTRKSCLTSNGTSNGSSNGSSNGTSNGSSNGRKNTIATNNFANNDPAIDKVNDCYASIKKNNALIELGINDCELYELRNEALISSRIISSVESMIGKINSNCHDDADRLEKLLIPLQISSTNIESALYNIRIDLENAEKRNEHRHKEAMALSRAIYKIIAPMID